MTGFEEGKSRRKTVPRSSHAAWAPPADRADPVEMLHAQETTRIANLLPVRHERMMRSQFAFYRGGAAIMAADLAHTPVTGFSVQAGGDCHLANFGAYGTPERNMVFDVNDFDETLPSPWEWDVKRLAASAVLLAQDLAFKQSFGRAAAVAATRAYRETIQRCAVMTPLEVWYWRLDATAVISALQSSHVSKKMQQVATHDASSGPSANSKLLVDTNDGIRIAENPPIVYHLAENDAQNEDVREAVRLYRKSLRDDLRVLFERYQVVDIALKVVGVGSVGTLCAIALCQSENGGQLVLQIKEATASVLEPYAGKSRYSNHGERVVTGQRLMQAASDMFLGWTQLGNERQFYVRSFRDMKAGVDFNRMQVNDLISYASLCGAALARGHARSTDPTFIAGYLGSASIFDDAVGDFAVAYAAQTAHDYGIFLEAIKDGRLSAGTASKQKPPHAPA